MPSPAFLTPTLKKYGLEHSPWLCFLVGDQLSRCLSCAHQLGLRTVWLSNVPSQRVANCHALALGGPRPDFSLLDFR